MPIQQNFPSPDTPLVDPVSGGLALVWFRFLVSLWNRSGGAAGNNSASFNYPDTDGTTGQVLTSQGTGKPSIWTAMVTKVSQLINDSGFITSEALVGLSTPASVNQQIVDFSLANASNVTPLPDNTAGSPGISTSYARADHVHPRETNPIYNGTVAAGQFATHGATWHAGNGAPTGTQAAGSMYSRTDGAPGTLFYVSNGVGWIPVA